MEVSAIISGVQVGFLIITTKRDSVYQIFASDYEYNGTDKKGKVPGIMYRKNKS
jgi:hypothetical protein